MVRLMGSAFWPAMMLALSFAATSAARDVHERDSQSPLACCASGIFDAEDIYRLVREFSLGYEIEVRTIRSQGCRLFVAKGTPGVEHPVAWAEILADGELDVYSKPDDQMATPTFTDSRTPPASGYTRKRCCGADRYTDEEFRTRVAMEYGLVTLGDRLKIHRDECRLSAVIWPHPPAPPDSHRFVEALPTGKLRFSSAP
jgi:hypothetical protein